MKYSLYRILAGSPEHRKELVAAGLFVAVWFLIDVIQFVDWIVSKFNPPQSAICLPLTMGTPSTTQNNIIDPMPGLKR